MKFIRKHPIGIQGAAALCMAAAILTACGGGGGSSAPTTPAITTGNITLTGNAAGSSITGMTNFTASNTKSVQTGRTVYLRAFVNAALTSTASLQFLDYGTGGSYVQFAVAPNSTAATPDASWLGTPAGLYACVAAAATAAPPAGLTAVPSCASLGVAVSRTAGTLSLTNSPSTDSISGGAGTISGSLSFTPF